MPVPVIYLNVRSVEIVVPVEVVRDMDRARFQSSPDSGQYSTKVYISLVGGAMGAGAVAAVWRQCRDVIFLKHNPSLCHTRTASFKPNIVIGYYCFKFSFLNPWPDLLGALQYSWMRICLKQCSP